MCVWVCVMLARHQITFVCKSAAFLQTFFFCLPHGSNIARPATSPSSALPPPCYLIPRGSLTFLFPHPSGSIGCQTDRQTSRRASDNRHGIWSAANLSQWYADKTNKYQVSLFLFPFRRSVFTLPAALPVLERESRERGGGMAKKLH